MVEVERALCALLGFMKAMTTWENECLKLEKKCDSGQLDWNDISVVQLKKLNTLQDKWCTTSKWRRGSCTFGWPADYDPTINKFLRMELIAKDKIVVEMQQTIGLETHIRIQLEKVGKDWKVARRWHIEYKSKKPSPIEL